MRNLIKELFSYLQLEEKLPDFLYYTLIVLSAAIVCFVLAFIIRTVILRLITKLVIKSKVKWDDHLLRRKVFNRIAYLVYPLIVSMFIGLFPEDTQSWIHRINEVFVVLVVTLAVSSLMDAGNDIYSDYEIAKLRPIKGFIQAFKIALFIISGIVIVSSLLNKTPLYILGGLGALTAVFMLVFQNSILGFVAGVQLTSNDMVRIGDWIEMPKYDANGTVTEMSLSTVKVENFDRTITSIPANALVSDSFKNWRGMQDCGARRIMRSIYVDIASIGFCTLEQLEGFKKIRLLDDYISVRSKEIQQYNERLDVSGDELVNGRHMTNIGVFRMYILNYLKNHPSIRQDMIIMVRQLATQSQGLGLELYAFASTTKFTEYEDIQSDIFDHILAVAPVFGLRIFQSPTGYDIKSGIQASK
ncbi:MAG: mechanosensitive ion channel family protein [Eubacteriales bacterium]